MATAPQGPDPKGGMVMAMDEARLFHRMLDVIEDDILPLTRRAVPEGHKIFGAAVLRADDLSLVRPGTNHEAWCPLWHGEVYTIKEFFEDKNHPRPEECLFLSTHEPCSMCLSALAWSGFPRVYFFFGYEQKREVGAVIVTRIKKKSALTRRVVLGFAPLVDSAS